MSNHDAIIPAAQDFYARLADNNTKDWWQDHKAEYETRLKTPAQALLADVASQLGTMHNDPIKTKIFRPHRDVRFSKDKTPYNTHLHLLWTLDGVDTGPGWFFGVSPSYVRIGWGWMRFTPTQIATWRDAVTLTKIPNLIADTGADLSDPELKRIPTGFDKDHPHADHLRRKSIALWTDGTPIDIQGQIMGHFRTVEPVHRELAPLLI